MKLFLVIGLLLIGVLLFGCLETGKGTATDSIARVSDTGLIWKTWKVQLTNDHPTDENPMQYGIEHDQNLIDSLQTYAGSKVIVKIFYTQYALPKFWEYGDSEIIYKVEPSK